MTNRRYKALCQEIEKLRAKLAKERTLLHDEVARHLVRHALPSDMQCRLVTDVRDGIAFCCKDGYRNLAVRLDDRVWIDVLHAFAYEHMGCDGGDIDPETAEEYARKLEKFFDESRDFGRAQALVTGLL